MLGTWIESVKSFMKWLVIARSCVSIVTSFVQQRPVDSCLGIYNSEVAATTVSGTVV